MDCILTYMRSIHKGWDLLQNGLKWQVRDRNSVLFWKNHQVGEAPLMTTCKHSHRRLENKI